MRTFTDRQLGTALATSLAIGTVLLAIEGLGSNPSLANAVAEWRLIAQFGLALGLAGGTLGIWMFGYTLNKGAKCWGLFFLMVGFLNIFGLLLFFYFVYLPQVEEKARQSPCSA